MFYKEKKLDKNNKSMISFSNSGINKSIYNIIEQSKRDIQSIINDEVEKVSDSELKNLLHSIRDKFNFDDYNSYSKLSELFTELLDTSLSYIRNNIKSNMSDLEIMKYINSLGDSVFVSSIDELDVKD